MKKTELQIHGIVIPIDATSPEFLDRPLWAVYGQQFFSSIICCKVVDHPAYGLTIWGYSVYEYQPGFRTLGRDLRTWAADNGAIFFAEQRYALQFIANITTPAKGA